MATSSDIPEDAIVFRHIPGGTFYQQPPSDRITSKNFQLREDEVGISVSISSVAAKLADAMAVLQRLKRTTESKVAFAFVREVTGMGFDVVRDPTADDPQHAIIRSGTKKLESPLDRKQLAMLFQYVV